MIKNRLIQLKEQIHNAEESNNRTINSVQLLAVSKTWSAETLRQAAEAGQSAFGENYLQEALIKIKELSDLALDWHFIGPIQSNKTKDIAQHFDWVQSLDRAKIAQRLSKQRSKELSPLNICIQVNIDNEDSKSGVNADELFDLAHTISQLDQLTLRGLMVIPSKTDDPLQQRASFARAQVLFQQLAERYPSIDTLSMGMSADMPTAVAEGSTMVRIGTGLFGQRATPHAHADVK